MPPRVNPLLIKCFYEAEGKQEAWGGKLNTVHNYLLRISIPSSDLGRTICLPWSLEDSERKMCYTWVIIMERPRLSVKQHGGKMV